MTGSPVELTFAALAGGARYRLWGDGVDVDVLADDAGRTACDAGRHRLALGAPRTGQRRVILNIDRSWTRLVALRAKLLRRPQVARDRAPVPVVAARSEATPTASSLAAVAVSGLPLALAHDER